MGSCICSDRCCNDGHPDSHSAACQRQESECVADAVVFLKVLELSVVIQKTSAFDLDLIFDSVNLQIVLLQLFCSDFWSFYHAGQKALHLVFVVKYVQFLIAMHNHGACSAKSLFVSHQASLLNCVSHTFHCV